MAKDVTIYTSNTCAYCHATKEYFGKKNVEYNEINIDEQPDRRQELVDISGQMAVPVIMVTKDDDSKEMIVGYNVPKLASVLGA
ncbi:MAG: glutaredoxin family protein [Candidatus Saccharimonadales bacterium]